MQNNIRPTLYIDFDNTLFNSTKKFVDMWKRYNNGKSTYKPIHWTEIYTYDFKELNVSKEEMWSYFNSPEFFVNLEFLDSAESVINILLEKGYKIKIPTMGKTKNLSFKESLLNAKFRDQVEFIGIDIDVYQDKSHIDMSDGIQIDDEVRRFNTNARHKICFGDIYEWNEEWQGVRCWNWIEVLHYIEALERNNYEELLS